MWARNTIGLKSDGTVVAVGFNDNGQLKVSFWTDIVQVAAGGDYSVGLKSDDIVVSTGRVDVYSWTHIVQIAALTGHTVGLRSDGTVVTVGGNYYGQCNVYD